MTFIGRVFGATRPYMWVQAEAVGDANWGHEGLDGAVADRLTTNGERGLATDIIRFADAMDQPRID